MSKILKQDELAGLRERYPGKRIGFCTGCFDLIHAGHAVFFAQAREHADVVVVGLGNDNTLQKLKGISRPVTPEPNRLYLVAAFGDVDHVVLNSDLEDNKIDFREVLEALQPNVFVLNSDDDAVDAKQRLCENLEIECVRVPRDLPRELIPSSSSQIIDHINYALRCPLRIDFAGGWTDIPFLMKGAPGYVSNAAIRPLVELRQGQHNFAGYPRGSGLTTSTAAKILDLLNSPRYVAAGKDLHAIAEDLFQFENKELHWAIGRQDMYALTYGGFNCFRCEADTAIREEHAVTPDVLTAFRQHLVLLHTSQSRNAQSVVEDVYQHHATDFGREALQGLAELGLAFSDALGRQKYDECGEIMHRNWEQQKTLAPASTTPVIDEIYEAAYQTGARGKLCGAGGGGAFVFYADDAPAFLSEMKLRFSGCFEIDFEFELRDIKTLNGI